MMGACTEQKAPRRFPIPTAIRSCSMTAAAAPTMALAEFCRALPHGLPRRYGAGYSHSIFFGALIASEFQDLVVG